MKLPTWIGFVILLAALAATSSTSAAEDRLEYNRDIRPILSANCFACHGPDASRRKADLRLDTSAGATADLDGRRAIVAGRPEESELIRRITADAKRRMPPAKTGKTLSDAAIKLLRRWIADGADYQEHWAFLPIRRPELPVVKDSTWARNGIDHFILARLDGEGLQPAPAADRATLLRRVSLDLTGLPPTPTEVDAFVADRSPGAYEKLVERLLASPRYGERMAVDWLDAARFADSNGYQVDRDREMWPWRDWVIRAFNRNLPFDQFTIEQLAGDLLPNPSLEQKVATGFHRNHMLNEEGGIIPEEFLAEYVADRVETTATVWLGLTLGCARCHDHKFDPLPQKDFYGLYAFFHNIAEQGVGNYGAPPKLSAPPLLKLPSAEQQRQLKALTARITEVERTLAAVLKDAKVRAGWEKSLALAAPAAAVGVQATSGRLTQLQKERAGLELQMPTMMVMAELPAPRPTFLLRRGQYDKKGAKVEPATPARLPPLPVNLPRNRLGLARWLVDPANPLPARVTVNRYWQAYFGTGLVRTAEDFGSQGELPSHPELLDWLASEFVRSGWDVKAMQRLIVTSATYRQASTLTSVLRERDPENRLLARGPRLRLAAEVIRDQALAVSGLLLERQGGPSVKPYHPSGLYEQVVSQGTYDQSHGPDLYRRSLYTYWKRSVPHPALLAFDAPFRENCVVRRARTATPLQALNLMNDPTYVETARFLGQRMLTDGGAMPAERIAHGFRLALARSPRPEELAILQRSLQRFHADFRADNAAVDELLKVGEMPPRPDLERAELAAYATLAATILNLDEMITKE